MERLQTVAGVLGALMLLASGSSASDAPEHPGTISGAVVSSTTGAPVAGAYVGIGDFGDAGGANLERFRKQGLYAETETDQQGRFALNGAAVPGEHPLVITHPEFVRHDQTVALGGRAEAEVEVRLKPAATIEATAVDAHGNALGGRVLVRLEALDGRRFIPPGRHRHLSTFASSVWLAKAKAGAFAFTGLDAGQYALDVLQLGDSQMRYHGGLARVEVELGRTEQAQVEPADHQTEVTIEIAKSPFDPEIPPLVVVSRNPGLLLWCDGKTHSLEDPRLGRIVENALFYSPIESGGVYTVGNLPPGTYSVFGGAAVCMGGAKLTLAVGEKTTVEVPFVPPDAVARVNLSALGRRVNLEARAYTVEALCELLTAGTDGRVRFRADPAIRNETLEFRAEQVRMWDVVERLYLEAGLEIEEEGADGLVLVPASKAEALRAGRQRATDQISPPENGTRVSYEETFLDLHQTLAREYPCFDLKGIDWSAVGDELLPRVRDVATDDEFGLVCLELVARLEDSHADLGKGTRELPQVPFARWDPGFACLVDDRGEPVVYYIDPGGPADAAGVKVGMTVVSIDGTPAAEAIERSMRRISRHVGYSSDRYLRYDAARQFYRRMEEGGVATLEMHDPDGQARTFELPATLGVRYLPRLPVPIAGISDSANVSWTMLDGDVAYLYVRRIRGDLIEKLDRAVGELKDARGLVVDVRGNSGGGFDFARSHRNFDSDDVDEPDRPRFAGPMALVIDARCISAGEGWASWFVANKRARVFGEATAGASSRKRTYTLENGFYAITFPVKAYRGYLDRPIERLGLVPDVPLRQNARDLTAGCDTVLEAARQYLLKASRIP